MSNTNEDNAIELEKKFLTSKKIANELIEAFEKTGAKATLKRIEQNYLFKENSSITYDVENSTWNVTLKTGESSETYLFKEVQHPKIANEILTQYSGMDLLDTQCSTRIRIMNGEPIFTFKRPIDGEEGDNEFEQNIQTYVENSSIFADFIKNDPYKVNKDRKIINVDEFNYEIDYFDDIDLSKQDADLDISILESEDLCLLEVEFDTKESYDNFIPNFPNINVSKNKNFSNKKMAKDQG